LDLSKLWILETMHHSWSSVSSMSCAVLFCCFSWPPEPWRWPDSPSSPVCLFLFFTLHFLDLSCVRLQLPNSQLSTTASYRRRRHIDVIGLKPCFLQLIACNDHQVCHVHLPPCWHITQVSGTSHIDWCCFYYFLRNSLVALLEALFARICVHGDAWYLCILYTQDYASTCIIFLSQSRTPTAGHCAPDIRLVEWRALRDVSAPLCPCRIDNSRSFVTSIVVASLLD